MTIGPKRIENRNWPVPAHIIGQTIAVHASAKWDPKGEQFLLAQGILVPSRAVLPKSAFVGVATVVGCIEKASYDQLEEVAKRDLLPDPDQERFFFGEYGQVWKDTAAITPIAYPGQLGFFQIPPEIAGEILRRVGQPVDNVPTPPPMQAGMPWEPPGGLRRRPLRRGRR